MKKIFALFLCIFILFLSGCDYEGVANNDWSYELINGYEIWHINSEEIVFGKRKTEHSLSTMVGGYIYEFCYGTRYIGLKNTDNKNEPTIQFYLIDTTTGTVEGPLSQDEYNKALESKEITELTNWIATVPRPSGATFK